MKLILASNSPRRKEIITDLGYDFICLPADIDENIDLKGEELVLELSKRKAEAVFKDHQESVVLGSDTIVYMNDKVYGKPKSIEDCFLMLKELSGKKHSVITGVTIINKEKEICFFDEAYVTFKELSDEEIYEYIDTKEPFDKAGGYAIQGIGKKLIKEYDGDFYTIMGLPKEMVRKNLEKFV